MMYSAVVAVLELPSEMRVHPVFHVSMLRKYVQSVSFPQALRIPTRSAEAARAERAGVARGAQQGAAPAAEAAGRGPRVDRAREEQAGCHVGAVTTSMMM
jgi:hypothetical protein